MSRQTPVTPDAMPLREALRGLRFMLRRGGETLVETLSVDSLPKPAADLAGAVLREVGELARSVDGMASEMAKTVLGGHENQSLPLQDMIHQQDAAGQFAAAFYVALSSVVRRLGAPSVFISEAAAKSVFTRTATHDPGVSTTRQAANMTISLIEAKVVRGTTAEQAARVPGSALEPVAIFAVMLWLQAARSEAENEAALDAATDLAVALALDIAGACTQRNAEQIEALYTRLVPHV